MGLCIDAGDLLIVSPIRVMRGASAVTAGYVNRVWVSLILSSRTGTVYVSLERRSQASGVRHRISRACTSFAIKSPSAR